MKYMGAKTRIAKEIVPIIQQVIYDKNITKYIEPFCGGELFPTVSRELYSAVRNDYRANTGIYEDWQIGNVGFLASYNGRFFDGGYAQPGFEKTKHGDRYRDYYREASENIKKQIPNLEDVSFACEDYREITSSGAAIYCDPPYANEKQYANSRGFDYAEFWETMRMWSHNNYVFISEMSAPDDFVCVWEKSVLRSIKATDKSRDTEKLYVWRGGLLGKDGLR